MSMRAKWSSSMKLIIAELEHMCEIGEREREAEGFSRVPPSDKPLMLFIARQWRKIFIHIQHVECPK